MHLQDYNLIPFNKFVGSKSCFLVEFYPHSHQTI